MPPTDSPGPDSRFIQANERTLLAWVRTSLALVTFGFVIARLGTWLDAIQPDRRTSRSWHAAALGACFVVMALIVDILALVRYRRVLAALRAGREVPVDKVPLLFGWAAVALSVLVVVYMVADVL
jgi:putative membrane protein